MVWYYHLFKNFPQFLVIHTIKDFSTVNKEEEDVFLQSLCSLHDPTNADNLISGFSAFSKSACASESLSVHVPLKPSWKDFEHNFTSM